MDNISPYLRGSKKRENIITGEVEDWSVATQPDINELYEARKFREVDRVERATELQFDKLETQKYPEIGSANAFSQGEKLAHLSSSTRNPKIQSAIDRLHKKHDLVASEFSQIDTRMMDDIFNSDLADQRVRTDKKAFESLQETRKQMGKDFTPTFDAQQSVNEIQVISRQLDNAPDKQVVESTSKKFRDYGSKTDDVTQTITTGTVDGVPVYKIEHKYSVPKNPLQIPEEIFHVELYIPNEAGLARLSKQKNNITKRDMLTGLRDRNNKGGEIRQQYGVGGIASKLAQRLLKKQSKKYNLAESQKTQIATTGGTYKKAAKIKEEYNKKTALDYGSGMQVKSAKQFLNADTFEPYPKEKYQMPDFTDPKFINKKYDFITNFSVLNVLPKDSRDFVVKDIGRLLDDKGIAVITARSKKDVVTEQTKKNAQQIISDSEIITKKGTYQKGFTQEELKSYLNKTLGKDFEVIELPNIYKMSGIGALVKRK